MKKTIILAVLLCTIQQNFAQENPFNQLSFIIGNWQGTGSGFGSNTSKITASYTLVMGNKYIEVQHESKFEPTANKPKGDHHIDRGFISFDAQRNKVIYRQFNNEGFINQYVLNEELSDDTTLVFVSELIENFPPGGKARLTLKKIGENELETIFDVAFPNKEFSCFGINKMVKN